MTVDGGPKTHPYRTARDRLDRVLAMLRRALGFWLPAGITLFFGCAGAVTYAVLRPRVYKSETLILYREGIRSADLGGTDSGGDPARKLGLRLREMVLARTSLERVITDFNLYPQTVADRGMADAVEEMRAHISFRVKDSDTFWLSFEGETPERVRQVTSRLARALIDENSRNRARQAEDTREFLSREKDHADAELKTKETLLARFLAKHPEFARETQQGQAGSAIRAAGRVPQVKPTAGDPAGLALEREAGRIQARLGMPVVKKEKRKPDEDPHLAAERQAAENDVASAQKDLSDKLSQFTEQHPDVRAAKVRLKNAQDRQRRASEMLSSTPVVPDKELEEPVVDRTALEAELHHINDEIVAHKKKRREQPNAAPTENESAQKIVALETDWTQLNREVTEARERAQQLQDKQFKATMLESAVASERNTTMTIVDEANLPTHAAKPGRATLAGLGGVLALILATLVALLLAFFDDRIYDRMDLEAIGMEPIPLSFREAEESHVAEPPRKRTHELPLIPSTPPGRARTRTPAPPVGDSGEPTRNDAVRNKVSQQETSILPRIVQDVPMVPQAARNTVQQDPVAAARARALTSATVDLPQPPSRPPVVEIAEPPRSDNAKTPPRATELPRPAEADGARKAEAHSGEAPQAARLRVATHKLGDEIDERLAMLTDADSSRAASFRVLRHRLVERGDPRVLVVSSPRRGDGKTTLAANLAVALAECGRARVLLVEANTRKPALAALFRFLPPECFAAQLERHRDHRDEPWNVVAISHSGTEIHVAAVRPDRPSAPLVDGLALGIAIETLRRSYDYLVLDTPPVLGVADVNLAADFADGVLLAARARQTSARDLRSAVAQIGQPRIAGVTLLDP